MTELMQRNLASFYEALKSFQDELKSRFYNLLFKIDLIISNLSKNEKLKNPLTALILVCFIALLAAGAYLVHRHINPVSSSDSVVFLRTAKYIYLEQVYRGDGTPPDFLGSLEIETITFLPMPIYPLILAAFFYLFGYTLESATLVSPLFGLLTIIMVYFVGSRLFNRQVGVLSALILAFIPYFWLFATRIVSEVTQTFFFLLALYFLYSSPKTTKSLIALSICSMACFLTKINGVLIYPIIFLTLFVRKELKIKFIATIIVASFLPLLPWLILSIAHQHSIFGGYGWMLEGYYLNYIRRGQIGYVFVSPNMSQAFKVLFGVPGITSWQVLVFSAVGIFIAIGKEFKVSLQMFISMSIIIWSATRYAYVRYMFLIIPLFAIFAAYGVFKIYKYIFQDMSTFPNLLAFVYIFVIILGLSLSLYVMGDYFVRTLNWLSLNLSGPSLVAPISLSPIFMVSIVIISISTAIITSALSQGDLTKEA